MCQYCCYVIYLNKPIKTLSKLVVRALPKTNKKPMKIGGKQNMNLRKMKKQVYAVSPVIATLMLVLVSVGSAGVFYVWQSNWQETTTDSVDTEEIKATLQLGGSSTVYPVSVQAAEAFMQEFPQYKVEVKSGGSDSGCMGAGEGILDIGAASKPVPEGYWSKYDNLVQITIGYDGVVPIVAPNSPHGLESINRTTLAAIYAMNGNVDDANQEVIDWAQALDTVTDDDVLQWNEIPKQAGNMTAFCSDADDIIVTERTVGSGTEECFGDKLLDEVLGGKEFSLTGDLATGAENNQGVKEIFETHSNKDDLLGFMAYGMTGGSPSTNGGFCYVVPFGTDIANVENKFANDTGALPTYAEIADGSWPGSRPLNYVTSGEPTGLTAKFINYVLWTSNNMEFLGDNGYVSLYELEEEGSGIWAYSYEQATD